MLVLPQLARAEIFELPGQLSVNQNGAATYSMPIAVPPGTAGMAPSLSLNYSSQAGNGIVGMGWSLGGLPAITRCPRTVAQDGVHGGVNLDPNDRFCLDGQRLMLVSGTYGGNGAVYGTEIEGFSQITSYGTAGTGPAYFKVQTKTGQIMYFGNTTDSRVIAQGTSTALSWDVNQISDTKGNYMTVTYYQDTANSVSYPVTINYTGNANTGLAPYNAVTFFYNTAPVPQLSYVVGSQVQIVKQLSEIQTAAQGGIASTYLLTYYQSGTVNHSELTGVQRCGGDGVCLPATTFGWQGSRDTVTLTGTAQSFTQGMVINAGDFNFDGLTDLLVGSAGCGITSTVYLGNQSNTFTASSMTISTPTGPGWMASTCTLSTGDFNADGYPDILEQVQYTVFTGGFFHHYYLDFDALNTRSLSFDGGHTIFNGETALAVVPPGIDGSDFNGDGRSDIFIQGVSSSIGISNGDGTFTYGSPLSGYDPSSVQAYIADFDGDGCIDLLAQGSDNSVAYSCNPATTSITIPDWTGSGQTLVFGDFNGDGKTDVLVVSASAAGSMMLSTGTGFVTTSFAVPAGWGSYEVVTGDFNGDGKTDIALISHTSGTSSQIYLSTGTGFVLAASIANSDTNTTATVADYNNDGASDLWIQKASGDTEYTTSYVPELMTSVTTGNGATSTITYDRLNHGTIYTRNPATPAYPTQNVINAAYAVSQLAAANGVGGSYITTYAYTGAETDLSGRGGLGFATMTVTDPQTGIVQTTTYSQTFPYTGQATLKTTTYGSVTLSQVINTLADMSFSGGRYFPYVSQSVQTGTDLDGYSPLPTYTTNYTYDTYGNATNASVSTSDYFTKTTVNTYNNDTTDWYIGQLTDTTVTAQESGFPNIVREVSFSYDATDGLTGQKVEPGTAYELDTAYTLDSYGNRTQTQVSGSGIATRTSTVSYDVYGRFPVTLTNALGQSETRAYDARSGGMTSDTDPNGLTTSWGYDGFGRKTVETRPDGTQTIWAYTWASGCAYGNCYVTATSTVQPTITQYYDILERPIYQTYTAFDGSTLSYKDLHFYDGNGRVQFAYLPYFFGSSLYYTAYTYDALGRVTTATAPDSSVTTYQYHGTLTSVTDALGHTTTTIKNSQGKPTSVTDALSPAGTTTYVYDAFSDLLTTTDPLSNTVTMTYDVKGRMATMTDPDRGYWTYTYDVLDELTNQLDANSHNTTASYDLLGRMTQRVEVGLTSNWTYDSRPLGIGKLATATTTAGYSRIESYDSLSRPIQTSLTLPGGVGPFLTTKSYDGYGRLSTVQYPSTFVEGFTYNGAGYLTAITNGVGGAALWTPNARDASLNVTQETAGNGVVTNLTYDPHVERLTAISTGGGSVQNKSYAWDTVGNLTQRVDSINGVTENFTYDPDNRVKTANIVGGVSKSYYYDAIGNITSKSDVGTYSYPASGTGSVRPHAVSSIAGSVNNGPGSGGVYPNPSYAYDANGNMTSGGGRSMSYTAFNVPATIANASTTQTFTFDPEHNRISQVEVSSLAGAAAGTTLYLNGGGILSERFTNSSTGVVTWRNYIVADGETKALVNQTANTAGPNWAAFNWEMAGQPGARNWTSSITATAILYLHSDHLGSIAAITNSSAALSEQDAYDAWGKRRNLNGADDTLDTLTSQTTRGYTDQEELTDVALLHLNGRVYDPQLGKLTSGDPLVSQPYGTQGWNRYAYVLNNPLNTVDPSGFDFVSTYCYTPPTPSADIDDNDIVTYATPQPVCTTTTFSTAGFNAGPGVGAGFGKGTAPKCSANDNSCIEVHAKAKVVPDYFPVQYAYNPFSLFGFFGPQSVGRGLMSPRKAACEAANALSARASYNGRQAAYYTGAAAAALRIPYTGEIVAAGSEFIAGLHETVGAIEGIGSGVVGFGATGDPSRLITGAASVAIGNASGVTGVLGSATSNATDQLIDSALGEANCDAY